MKVFVWYSIRAPYIWWLLGRHELLIKTGASWYSEQFVSWRRYLQAS